MEKTLSFKGVITTDKTSNVITKSNGSNYVLQNVELSEGPLKGEIISAERTILNSSGETKEPFAKGEEVLVYVHRLPSTKEPGTWHYLFTLSEVVEYADQTTIRSKMDALFSNIVLPVQG